MSTTRFWRAGIKVLLGAFLIVPAFAAPAGAARHQSRHAAAPPKPESTGVESLGQSDSWAAFASHDKTGRVCYLVGQPRKSEPSGFARKSPMAMVTHRPAENISNVVSFVEGYPLKPGSDVTIDIDGRKFTLFTKDDSAWARTSELDRTIVTALDGGKSVTVRGEPQRGPATVDTYSLAGFSKALALIDKACGVKRESEPARPAPKHRPSHHRHHHAKHKAHG